MIEFLADLARGVTRFALGLAAALAIAALAYYPRLFYKTDPVAVLVLVGGLLLATR